MASTPERMMLVQINTNLVRLISLLLEIQRDGLKVTTQESHQP